MVSSILINEAKVYRLDGGAPGNSVTFDDPGLSDPLFGGVQLTLDMTIALCTGVYSSAVNPA